jgi:hypothetical protein
VDETKRVSVTRPAEARRGLVLPALVLLTALVLHDLDHLRQGRSIEPLVIGLGVVGDIGAITALVLAVRGSRLAPVAAVLVGFATALGFVLVHVVPDWGPLSDGYPDLAIDGVSWILVAIPMAAALWLGANGVTALRRSRT